MNMFIVSSTDFFFAKRVFRWKHFFSHQTRIFRDGNKFGEIVYILTMFQLVKQNKMQTNINFEQRELKLEWKDGGFEMKTKPETRKFTRETNHFAKMTSDFGTMQTNLIDIHNFCVLQLRKFRQCANLPLHLSFSHTHTREYITNDDCTAPVSKMCSFKQTKQ